MALPVSINPINYIVNKQYYDSIHIRNDLFKKRFANARNLFRKDLLSHYGCVNAIEFSNEGELLISGGDDRRVLLWSVPHAILDRGEPIVMSTTHLSNIFCLGFDSQNSKIYSAGNDDQVIVHDLKTGSFLINFLHEKPVYGLSINPQNDFVFASAGEDGRVLIYDIRDHSAEPLCLARYKTAFHAVMFNPVDVRFIATANTEEGIALWDYRKPKEPILKYGGNCRMNSGMSVRFNSLGTQLLALRRRLPPILYSTHEEKPICQFYHPDYYNSCTMKSCTFAGQNDEYVLSGSDDFNLYMWRIPKDGVEWGQIHIVLLGHRSIVNQIRFNKQNNLIASSGVEKMVKLWSPLQIGTWEGSIYKETIDKSRQVFSHEEYISLVQNNGQLVSHDYSHQSTLEDSRMMAFFDSLVQREIEGWHMSDDTISSDSDYDSSSNLNYLSQRIPGTHSNRLLSADKKGNRIAQLIYEKREHLAKMAQKKSRSTRKHKYPEKQKKKKSKAKSCYVKISNKIINGNSTSKHSTSSGHTSSGHSKRLDRSKSTHKSKSHKYKTRYNTSKQREEVQSSESLDMPSTSTGITASGSSVYHRIYEQDSDEEQLQLQQYQQIESTNGAQNDVEQPLVNILPTPLNGTHDMYINILQIPVQNTSNVITVRNETNYDNYTNRDSESSSGELEDAVTPNGKYTNIENYTPDSGISSRPCSTGGSNSVYNMPCSSGMSNRQLDENSDDPDWNYETFKKRLKRARMNLRNNINGDSDSN